MGLRRVVTSGRRISSAGRVLPSIGPGWHSDFPARARWTAAPGAMAISPMILPHPVTRTWYFQTGQRKTPGPGHGG